MPVVAECSPLVGYVADCRDAVCNESHLRGVATLAWAVFQEFKHSLLTASAGAEAVAVLLELCLEDGCEDLVYGLLNCPVNDRRNTELTYTSVGFGYLYPPYRRRFITPLKD